MNKLLGARRKELIQIVIPTYNRPLMLDGLLKGLHQEVDERFDVVIVDDGSSPENRMKVISLSKEYPKFRFILNETNLGGAKSRNVGAEGVSNWIWFVDDDDRPPEDALKRIADGLKNANLDEGLILLGARCVRDESVTTVVPQGGSVFAAWARFGSEVNTSCAIFRRDIFEEIGGWDPALIAGQDTDLFLRAARVTKAFVMGDVFVDVILHSNERITTNPRKQMRGKLQFLLKNWSVMHWRRTLRYLISLVIFYPYIRKYLRLW